MGRKKIKIKPIVEEKTRNITFNKRKTGLLKKAAELSMLCNINVYLVFTDINGNIIHFSSPNCDIFEELIENCQNKQVITFDQSDYPDFFKQKKQSNKQTSDHSSVQTDEDQIEENYSEIEEKLEEYSECSADEKDKRQNGKKNKSGVLQNKIKEINRYHHVTRSKIQEHLSDKQQQQSINDNQYQQYNQKSFVKPKNLKITIPKQNQFLKAQMTLLKQFNLKKQQQSQPQNQKQLNDNPLIIQQFQQQNLPQQQQQIPQFQQQQQHFHQQLQQNSSTEGDIINCNQFNRDQLLNNNMNSNDLNYQQYMNTNLLSQQNHILFQNMEKILSFPDQQQNNLPSSNFIQSKYNLRNSSYGNKNNFYDMKSPDTNDLLNFQQTSNNLKSGNNFMIDRALDVRADMQYQYNNIVSPQELLVNQSQQQQMHNENYIAYSANSMFNNNKELYHSLQNNNLNIQNNIILQSKKIKKIKSKQN